MERAKGFGPKGPRLPAFQKADVSNHTRTVYKSAPKNASPSEGTKTGKIFQEFSGKNIDLAKATTTEIHSREIRRPAHLGEQRNADVFDT